MRVARENGRIMVVLGAPATPDSDAFLGALLESLSAGVVACDAAGQVVFVNRAMREIRGFPATLQRIADALLDLAGLDGGHLGLARTIVHLHGGTIRLTPNDPSGTIVCVRLPLI